MAVYVCVGCGHVGKKRPEAEAMAEAMALFPEGLGDDFSIVCDDCHQKFLTWMKKYGLTGRLSEDREKIAALERLRDELSPHP